MPVALQLAQLNIGLARGDLEGPVMKGFMDQLAEINALADASPGFVWRLQSGEGNATYLRPYDDERIIVNLSVWDSVEALQAFVYRSAHTAVMRRRQEWFEKFPGNYVTLWWVPAGHRPSIDEAKARLAHLEAHGPTAHAFTFKQPFAPDHAVVAPPPGPLSAI